MTLRAVRNAVIAALQGDLSGSVFTSSGVPVPAPARYAVVFVARSRKDRTRYTGPQSRDTFTVTVHCVGADEELALWVQERVDKLTGKRLTVSGAAPWAVEYVTGHPPDLDDDGPSPLWFSVSQFDIVSDPA